MKTDEEVKRQRDDAQMMRRDHLWPQMCLPLKRHKDGDLETAVLLSPPAEGEKWSILEGGNLFDLRRGRPVEYDSPEAIVAAGWLVD